MKRLLVIVMLIACGGCVSRPNVERMLLDRDEYVWAGIVNDGSMMPLQAGYGFDFSETNRYNQIQPLLLTSKGRYIWSEHPFRFEIKEGCIEILNADSCVIGRCGETLTEAYDYVSRQYFPPSGAMPDSLLFAAPQYNTWIELNFSQNQQDVLRYARSVVENGLQPGVLMIDDTWQEDYGLWDFHPGRFPAPKQMVDELHAMEFKVMLWIVPFVSPDQNLIYHDLKKHGALLRDAVDNEPRMIRWWNGVSAVLDLSNEYAVEWFNGRLDALVAKYGIDGFKFDAGDLEYYPQGTVSEGGFSAHDQCRAYAMQGLRFSLNEYRACWKMGGWPLAQRLSDKVHTWEALQTLIPNMAVAGLMGYYFSCPDMIGGGEIGAFLNASSLNQDLIVRSAQCHALMPMMQFSVAPWRILDDDHFRAVKKAVEIRKKFTPLILSLAKEAAIIGTPILRNMEYVYPNLGYASIQDQFMLGDKLLVAPQLTEGTVRTVVLPEGEWVSDTGEVLQGGCRITIDVPIDRLPYFEKIK